MNARLHGPTTHFIEVDAIRIGRRFRALCGGLVDASSYVAEPTCPECQRRLADDDAAIRALGHDEPTGT